MTPPFDPAGVVLRIRIIVEAAGSVSQVAKQCGLKQATLESIIRGQSLPNSHTLACLSAGLEVDAHWILFGKVFEDV